MADILDPWHFARPELAQAYLKGFDLGLTAARGLFARRRMGKTEFLNFDLLPAARQTGYLGAYTNLWDAPDQPGQAIASAILLAAKPKGVAHFWESLKQPIKKLKGSGKLAVIEASLELELEVKEKIAGTAIQMALEAADKSKKRLLLVIDEAQVLADPAHQAVAHSLRAALDIRKSSVKVLFAGSSESGLRSMFSSASAPFFNWAPIEPFPLLGEAFVEAMVEQTAQLARHPLAPAAAQEAFEALKETPEFFRWYIERYLTHQLQGAAAALAHTLSRVNDDTGFARRWKTLKREDRATLILVARGVQDLYGKKALQQYRSLLDQRQLTANVQRAALRRLLDPRQQSLARLDRGLYRFEDPEFERWVSLRKNGRLTSAREA